MAAETRPIEGTVVAITGASSGIGRATARMLASAGVRIAVTGRRGDRLAELEQEFGAHAVVGVEGDIQDPATSTRLVRAALDRFGRLDSLVAAAGWGAYGGILDLTDDELSEMTRVNFLGTVWSVRAAAREMEASGGDIVIISSVAGIRGASNEAIYAGTKAAQLVFAGAVDRELRSAGIRVTALCPAAVATEFAIGRGRRSDDPRLAEYMQAEDIAEAVLVVLRQPRRMRTTQWAMWSAAEAS